MDYEAHALASSLFEGTSFTSMYIAHAPFQFLDDSRVHDYCSYCYIRPGATSTRRTCPQTRAWSATGMLSLVRVWQDDDGDDDDEGLIYKCFLPSVNAKREGG